MAVLLSITIFRKISCRELKTSKFCPKSYGTQPYAGTPQNWSTKLLVKHTRNPLRQIVPLVDFEYVNVFGTCDQGPGD